MENENTDPLTDVAETTISTGWDVWNQAMAMADNLWRPWVGYQVLLILAVLFVAYCLSVFFGARLRAWVATHKGWSKLKLRIFVVIRKNLTLVFFAVLMWVLVLVMREITWPSRSYVLAIVANLAIAAVVVSFTSRLIGNRFVRKIVSLAAWAWIALRIMDLTDETRNILESAAVEFGGSRISAWMVLQAVFLLAVLFFLARLLSRTSSDRIRANEDISPSMQVLFVKILQILLYGAAFFIGLRAVGFDLTGLAVLSGAIGVGIGFGLQKVVSNLVSGFIILLDKSIKPGDVISLGDTFGWINALGARYVSITTRDGREYLVPNEDLITNQVVNWSHSNDYVRLDITFGTAYGDDPHQVRKLAISAAEGVNRVLKSRPAVCHITGFGDSSVDYVLRFWIRDPTGGLTNIRGNVYLALWDTFQENGISIPFPQREVKMLGDDA